MRLMEIEAFAFNYIEIKWHGPYLWPKRSGALSASTTDRDILALPGIYRAETPGKDRKIIKYIGSASNSFGERLSNRHTIYTKLVAAPRLVNMFLGQIIPEKKLTITRKQIVEIEYILQNVHYHDLISWHGLSKLPKTSRGEGWHITNTGARRGLKRIIAYPAFAISERHAS